MLYRAGRWVYLYNICKQPYDAEAREYMTYETLRIGARQWEFLEQEKKDDFLQVYPACVLCSTACSFVCSSACSTACSLVCCIVPCPPIALCCLPCPPLCLCPCACLCPLPSTPPCPSASAAPLPLYSVGPAPACCCPVPASVAQPPAAPCHSPCRANRSAAVPLQYEVWTKEGMKEFQVVKRREYNQKKSGKSSARKRR